MARANRDDDDDVPWLAEGVREERSTLVPRARLLGGGVIAVLLAVLVVLGVYLAAGHKSDGSAGYAKAEDAPLIAADAGAYKVPPTDPGGAQITGIDDSIAAAAGGGDQGSAIMPETAEEPLARPGTPGAAGTTAPPTDLLPTTIPPAAVPTRSIPTAPVVAPATVAPQSGSPAAGPVAATPTPAKATPLSKIEKTKPDPVKAAKASPPRDVSADPLAVPAKSAKPSATASDGPAPKPMASGKPKAADAPAVDKTPSADKPVLIAKPDRPDAAARSGTAALQLGAFSTRDKAEAAWTKAGGDGALAGLAKRIEPVERDGTTLYRLRAGGVGSKEAAKTLCGRVKAAGNACIVAE